MGVVTIYELLDILDPTHDYAIKATDKDDTIQTLISSDAVLSYMVRKYGSRKYKLYRGTHTTEAEASQLINYDWRMYLLNRQHGIDRMYQAMYDQDYSPIENVFAEEQENSRRDLDTTYGKTETGSHSDQITYGKIENGTSSDSTTYGKTETDTISDQTTYNTALAKSGHDSDNHSGSVQNENLKAGFNAQNSYAKDSKNIETYNNDQHLMQYNSTDTKTGTETQAKTDTLRFTGTDATTGTNSLSQSGSDTQSGSNSMSQSGKDQIDDIFTRTFSRHGNVGVTSSQELINQELDLYQKSLAEMIIDNFIDDYTFYA